MRSTPVEAIIVRLLDQQDDARNLERVKCVVSSDVKQRSVIETLQYGLNGILQ